MEYTWVARPIWKVSTWCKLNWLSKIPKKNCKNQLRWTCVQSPTVKKNWLQCMDRSIAAILLYIYRFSIEKWYIMHLYIYIYICTYIFVCIFPLFFFAFSSTTQILMHQNLIASFQPPRIFNYPALVEWEREVVQ